MRDFPEVTQQVNTEAKAGGTATIWNNLPGKGKRALKDLKLSFNFYGSEMTNVSFTDNSLAKSSHTALLNYKGAKKYNPSQYP